MKLMNEALIKLIARAKAAGNSNPSLEQLRTLAVATSDKAAAKFFVSAGLRDLVAIRNHIAATVYGEEPKKVSTDTPTVFGLEGSEAALPSEEQTKIFTSEPVAKTTEEQKDMAARRDIAQEDKQPETSDRSVTKPAVAEPLKVKIESEFKEILNRVEKQLDAVEKETAVKASKTTASTIMGTTLEACLVENCTHNKDHKCIRDFITIHVENGATGCLFYDPKNGDPIVSHAKRISRGESVKNVLRDFAAFLGGKSKQAVINPGDTIQVPDASGAQENVTFETGNLTPDGQQQLVGKDGAGNVTMVVPQGMDPMKIKDTNS